VTEALANNSSTKTETKTAADTGDLQASWLARGRNVLMNTYASFPIVIVNGKGSYVEDVNGKKYLDFVAGIAVNSLGHCDDEYVKAVSEQLAKLIHCSNLYLNTPNIELAEKLIEDSAFDRVFFCNSGAEAIEGSIKLSRKYAKETKGENCTKIISMTNSFHGRTYGALSATGQKKYQNGFQPLVPEMETVHFNDFESLATVDFDTVAAIIIEPIQGEGGVHLVDQAFLKRVRELCTDENIVLIFDEIQCGVGRTGKFFAHENFGLAPDIVALAKGLGGGFPIGAFLANEKIAGAFKNGDHGTTFGGNPLACTAALTCVNKIKQTSFLEAVHKRGQLLHNLLKDLQSKHPAIKDVRGSGLMVGIELDEPVKAVIGACLDNGLLLVGAGEKVIRMLPPLTVTDDEIKSAVSIFSSAVATSSRIEQVS
jgi:acetylornithine/N-succinyldiaminopimelate aminotransferase